MIDKLDVFISGGLGDAKYRQVLSVMYVVSSLYKLRLDHFHFQVD